MPNEIQLPLGRAYRVDEFCKTFRISRATFYALVHAGKFRTFRMGGRRLISAEVVEALLRSEELL